MYIFGEAMRRQVEYFFSFSFIKQLLTFVFEVMYIHANNNSIIW